MKYLKKLLPLLILVAIITLVGFKSLVSTVYICDSTTAKKYHYTSTCRGLNACKAKVVAISYEDAKKKKRTLCGWED